MSTEFDRANKLVTSYLFSPIQLAGLRILIAVYTLVTTIYTLVYAATTNQADSYFSYFTSLTYIGICAYFFASGVQTYFYAQSLNVRQQGYHLQRWPKPLRCLHVTLLSTVVTYPILVTIVYWALLASSSTFSTPYSAWSNISKHAFNTVFALFEILLTNIGPLPWLDLLVTIVILGLYLGLAYITHATQGIYTYSFLDPKKQGKLIAAYIIGIAVGQIIIFLIVTGVIHLRQRLVNRQSLSDVRSIDTEGKDTVISM